MRLTCPNCSAQYDIPTDMIPPDGRDVQCSNCGTVWFQEGQDAGAPAAVAPLPKSAGRRPLADEATLDVLRQERAHEARARASERRRSRTPSETESKAMAKVAPTGDAPRAAAAAERARMAAAASVARARDDGQTSPAEPEPAPAKVPQAVPTVTDDVSEAIARTLREMAEESRSPTDAPDGLAEPDEEDGAPRRENRRQARRDLLPDIEEINSSLRPDERAVSVDDAEPDDGDLRDNRTDRRSGFGVGFLTIMAVVALAVAAYIFAEPIGDAIPPLAGPLLDYVRNVDLARIALEARVDALAGSILQDQ